LDGAVSALPSNEQVDMIQKLSIRAAEWVEQNKDFSFEYKEICHRLQKLLQDFIDIGFFAEAIPVIDVFSKINNGTLKKDNLLREVSLDVLKNLASDNNIGILIREINTNGSNKSTEARKIIAGFGDMVIKKLLNNLLNASDSKQRISVIHIIEEMGEAAIPAISSSIKVNSPWYYLRNVAYIIGRIGNETSIETLQPLLLHKDKRVRKEAFKSINQTGGSKRGEALLSVLPQADHELRIDIIETLGKIKCTDAVTDLQDMIKTKTSMPKDEQISFHEKICNALGSIGSPEAIKVLTEIAESKSILGIGTYPKEVKYAAQRALASIKRR
jgi:HEAT repeat protein